jgi:CheY-like chemotaxis protein
MARRAASTGEPADQPLRVLLVEDNAVNRLLTTRQMARLGHTLHAVTTGAEGVQAALADRYDVILMDRHLPDLDGIEATEAIRAAETELGLRRTPIVAVTADAAAGHREQCLAAGMDAFLSKPVNLERLRAALTAVVPQPESAPGADMDVDPGALQALAHELDGDPELTAEVVTTYLAELPGRRLRVQTAIRQEIARGAIVAADGLRAASLTVGAVGVARICAEIGTAASAGDLELSRKYLPELLDACQRAADSLVSIASSGRFAA